VNNLLPGELPPPPPPAAALSSRREAIVGAARRLLESEGPSGLTMRRLADALEMQAPSLYKHFASKAAVELAVISEGLREAGAVTHEALHAASPPSIVARLCQTYRLYAKQSPHLYRLATGGQIDRAGLPSGLEEWAGNPWFVATGDPALARALWSFAHGMVILEIDGRYPPDSDLEAAWAAGAEAFAAAGAKLSPKASRRG
jgi:AcrR family transcriptional regulator